MARHWLLPGGEPFEIAPPIVVTGERGPVSLAGPDTRIGKGIFALSRFAPAFPVKQQFHGSPRQFEACGLRPNLPDDWASYPYNHPIRLRFRKWLMCMQDNA